MSLKVYSYFQICETDSTCEAVIVDKTHVFVYKTATYNYCSYTLLQVVVITLVANNDVYSRLSRTYNTAFFPFE